jgi:hypothetical protein
MGGLCPGEARPRRAGGLGRHVEDPLVDDHTWAIRYILVDSDRGAFQADHDRPVLVAGIRLGPRADQSRPAARLASKKRSTRPSTAG